MADSKKNDDYHISRPPAASRWQQFAKFLYNPHTHEVLGRTAKSWLQITVFYIILYAFLAGFFAGLLMVFFQTLDSKQPTWQMESSLIGKNPGMGYRPLHPDPDETVITFTSNNNASVTQWTAAVNKFLDPYYKQDEGNVDCDYGQSEVPASQSCRFKVQLNKCNKPNYGYNENTPCIYLKLNKIIGWTPDCYSRDEIPNVEDFPEDLRQKILALPSLAASNNVWVSCSVNTDSPNPEKNITVEYDGHFGFPRYFFPYTNQKGYVSPFVAVQIKDLPADVIARVSCRLWAKNIQVDRQRRLGMTNLEIMSKTTK